MKQKKINDILYVFDITPYQITEDTDASVIKVQLESYDGFVELNESLASKFVKYNYEMFTVHQQEWAPYVDAKEDADLEWSSDSATVALGETNTYPTLTNTDNVEVTYDSSDTSVATIASDGTITLLEAGTTTISAIFAGDDTYSAKTVSYSLLVKEVPDLAWSSDTATGTVGQQNALPTLTNTDNVDVTYNSSDTSVATIASDGTITLLTAGTTTISAIFAGDTTYVAKTVSYLLTAKLDYSKTYLTTKALERGNISFSGSGASYRRNNEEWTDYTNPITVMQDDTVEWKGTLTPDSTNGIGTIGSTGDIDAYGNVMSMLFGDNFANQTSLSGKDNAFKKLFNGNNKLISAENLILPATTLSTSCYESMFSGCVSLVKVPELPATTLAKSCYTSMFAGCTTLTIAQQSLPATSPAQYCYDSMFENCTSLTTAPIISATSGDLRSFEYMFNGCTSLTTVQQSLSFSTILGISACEGMFKGCTSLTTAPELPCTSLNSAAYKKMFENCTSLTTAPALPETKLYVNCYYNMFNGCTSLNNVTCLATNISANGCVSNWLNGTAASGTFYKDPNMTDWIVGDNVPSGWTIEDYSA